MKHLIKYKLFESAESDLMTEYIKDIFLDIKDDGVVYPYIYCSDNIVMISIKPNTNRIVINDGGGPIRAGSFPKKTPFNPKIVEDTIERVINYLADRVSRVSYTYAEDEFSQTKPTYTLPDEEIYELNVTIKLKKSS